MCGTGYDSAVESTASRLKNAEIEFEVKFESRVTVTFDLKKLIEGSRNKKKWPKIVQLLLLIALLCLLPRFGWTVFMVQ